MKYAAIALLAACGLLLFARCGAGGPSAGSAAATRGGAGFNSTDVMFLQMMVPHQAQGVKLAALAREHPVRPEVRTLAAAIESTQRAEAGRIVGRLRGWERPLRAPADAHHAHGGVVPETTDAELAALERLPADRFEREFLNLLIARQDDAVQLARMELGKGEDAWTRGLAAKVERSRSAQIDRMLGLLDPRVRGG
ncbi:DUF305 domain-containing protein [Actinomadura algeriensis]|uniref:Uncharacterized protein (DUF305 family) n=1 Tax=Actinomadura algeriensis TaxID=1679523 RepID=A0ABR9JJ33_9ACTN|nr:DUF305 domain-containing protein [Actinomadura algeriensis]MBE1530533.1 uncharacterized protein (DUF305 family) [Actinomadura algeriensis]